jgi:hypothetical protein
MWAIPPLRLGAEWNKRREKEKAPECRHSFSLLPDHHFMIFFLFQYALPGQWDEPSETNSSF